MSAIDDIDDAIRVALAEEDAGKVFAFITGAFVGLLVELVRQNDGDATREITLQGEGGARDITLHAIKGH